MPEPRGFIVTGPNHALHFVLTLLTCGMWAWVWLIIAAVNHRQVIPVDEYGNPLPKTPEQREADRRRNLITLAVVVGLILFFMITKGR